MKQAHAVLLWEIQKQGPQNLQASPFPVSSAQTKGFVEGTKTAGQLPSVPLRPQINFCEFLKGISDEVGPEDLGVVGYLFLYMKHTLRKNPKSINVS